MLISLDAGGDYYILLKTVRPERWRDNGRAAARHAFMTASCGSWQVTGPALGCEVARSRCATLKATSICVELGPVGR